METYLEAIALFGTDPRAYIKLLEAYQENGLFSDEESSTFTGRYNVYQDAFDKESDGYLELMYEAGMTYLYLYSGGDDTVRSRVLKAYPYFAAVAESGRSDLDFFAVSESYAIIGSFYTDYVVDATSVREPDLAAYGALLSSMEICMADVAAYDGADAAYCRLTVYAELLHLLNSHRSGFAQVGIARESVLSLLAAVRDGAEAQQVTQEKSLAVREEILEAYDGYAQNIERAYTNAERRE